LPQPVFQLGLDGDHLDRILGPATGHQLGRDVSNDGIFAGRAFPFAIQHYKGALVAVLVGAQQLVALGVDAGVVAAFVHQQVGTDIGVDLEGRATEAQVPRSRLK
jgi:hypothetical protein